MKLITICRNINNSVLKEDYEFWTRMRELYFKEGGEAVSKTILEAEEYLDDYEEDEEHKNIRDKEWKIRIERAINPFEGIDFLNM